MQLGDQSGYELSLRDQTNLLQAVTTANNATVTNLTLSQTAINSMTTTAQSAVETLTSLSAGANTSAATLQNTGTNALQELVQETNTSSNGQYLFGGINSGGLNADGSTSPTLTNYFSSTAGQTAFDTTFQNYFGFSTTSSNVSDITSAQMQDFLTGSSANAFSTLVSGSWTNWSNASSTNVTTEIAPGETATTSTNANDAGFQQLAEGYAMLSQFGGLSLSASAQQTCHLTRVR